MRNSKSRIRDDGVDSEEEERDEQKILFDRIVDASKIAIPSAVLILIATVIATYCLPSPSWRWRAEVASNHEPDFGCSFYDVRHPCLRFDLAHRDEKTTIPVGTPPRLVRLELSGKECGIVLWSRSAADSASWVSSGSDEYGVGMDVAVVDGVRLVVPVRYAEDAVVPETLTDVDGRMGLCPYSLAHFGVRDVAYHSRCFELAIGGIESPWADGLECAYAGEVFGSRRGDLDPWEFEACATTTATNGSSFLAIVDPTETTVPREMHRWGFGYRGSDSVSRRVFSAPNSEWTVAELRRASACSEGHRRRGRRKEGSENETVDATFELDDETNGGRRRISSSFGSAFVPVSVAVPRDDVVPTLIGGEDCARMSASVFLESDRATVSSCVDCNSRTRDSTIVSIVVATLLGIMWTTMTKCGVKSRAKRVVAELALDVVSLCFYASGTWKSDVAPTIGRVAGGIPRSIPDAFFAFSVIGILFARALLVALAATCDRVRRRRLHFRSIDRSSSRSYSFVPSHFERAAVEIPLFCSLWFVLHAQRNFLARTAIGIGSSLMASIVATTIAVGATTARSRSWPVLAALAGLVNLAVYAFEISPFAIAFLGDAVASRTIYCAAYISVVALPAIFLADAR